MYDNDSITLRFKVDVNGCMFCNSGLEHQHQWDLPWGKNVINLNNFDLLWLFFSAHLHFIDLYKMNLDFLCLNSQIVIFAQPVLLFAVYFWLANICHFLYNLLIDFLHTGDFLITFTIFSENLRLTLRFQVTESQCRWRFFSRYTYGINLTVLRHFVLKIARSQTLASTSRPTKPQVKQWSYSLSIILQYQYTLGTMGWESILWLVR